MDSFSLADRNLVRKKKVLAVFIHWLHILHLAQWFLLFINMVVILRIRGQSIKRQRDGADDISAARSNKRRRNEVANDLLVEVIQEASTLIGGVIEESTAELCRAIGLDIDVKVGRIDGELRKLPSLTMSERHKAGVVIGCDPSKVNIFFSISDDEKEEWVRAVLNNHM